MIEIKELQPQDKETWDAYLSKKPCATVYQLANWKDVMEKSLGLQTHFLYAAGNGQILGVLPLLYVKNLFEGSYITSMPGAICAESAEVAEALFGRAKELTRMKRAKYLVLRDSYQAWNLADVVTNDDHCMLKIRLNPNLEELWKQVDRKARQKVNKAKRANVVMHNGQDNLNRYYPVYAKAMRDKGTPTLGSHFFENALDQLAAYFQIMVVVKEDTILGGGFTATFGDSIVATWGGMLREYYNLHTSYLLYWETMKYGVEHGFEWLDLGRSMRDSGTYHFKKQWQAEAQPVYQQFYLNKASHPPAVGGAREDNASYQAFVQIWSHLPVPVAEILGPWLRKQMPFG